MATATESEIKLNASEPVKEIYKKSKAACPCCNKQLLYTNDSEKFDDIMHYSCMGCGYTFYEDESTRKWRKEQKKKSDTKQTWNTGFLLLLMMLATILAINVERNREEVVVESPQPVNSQPTNVQPVNPSSVEIRTVN